MSYSARLWLRLDAEQMERIELFRARSKRKTLTVAIRHLIQKGLDQEAARSAREKLAGALCVLYDCDAVGLARQLAELQLQAEGAILSKTRVRLDARLCLKVFAVNGSRRRIRALLDRLGSLQGVAHAWFIQCQGKALGAKAMRKALATGLAENGWAQAGRDMVLPLPLVLTCGAETLWRQLNALLPEGHDMAVSFSVHLERDEFLHVAVVRRPASLETAMPPLASARARGSGTVPSAAILTGADATSRARIGSAS